MFSKKYLVKKKLIEIPSRLKKAAKNIGQKLILVTNQNSLCTGFFLPIRKVLFYSVHRVVFGIGTLLRDLSVLAWNLILHFPNQILFYWKKTTLFINTIFCPIMKQSKTLLELNIRAKFNVPHEGLLENRLAFLMKIKHSAFLFEIIFLKKIAT